MGKRTRKELQQYWQHHLKQWKSSGLSGLRYCQQHDLSYNRFHYWKKRLSVTQQPERSPSSSTGFARVIQQQIHSPQQSDLTLTLPNGAILSGIQSDHIDTVVQLLERTTPFAPPSISQRSISIGTL